MKLRTEVKGQARPVKVGPGLAMYPLVTVIVEDWAGYDVAVEVVPEGGRLVARQVQVSRRKGGPPVTGETLRSIPVATFLKHAATHVLLSEEKEGYTEFASRVLTPEILDTIHRDGPSTASLEWVAYLYRLGLLMSEPPTQTVARALKLPRSTAGRWVAAARRRGFLGAAENPGKASV